MIKIPVIKISYDKLLSRLGYFKAKTKIDRKMFCMINEILNFSQKFIIPSVAINFENIINIDNEIVFKNGYKIKSFNVSTLLKNSFGAYGVVVTIGKSLERKRNDFLINKKIFDALILDAVGSVATEEVIKLVYAQIYDCEKEKKNILTKRYSPGYGDWFLEQNMEFVNWVGAEKIGVSLNEHYQMNPEKSVSAIIGVEKLEM
ncbi:MAG: hypothetical protein LBL03_00085 [Endomicrobium sp.]|jgi:hypothetical protein|nr:hypothetical protein [Endomicrobium sp.]